MTQDAWAAVDDYFSDRLLADDPVLDAVLAKSTAAGLPPIAVAPNQGKLLHLLARLTGARRVLEIGTLGGYSTIWLARALPADGSLVTIEVDPRHAEVARANIADAGFAEITDLRVGPALEVLPQLEGPFDVVFIDALKRESPEQFQWAMRLSRPGTAIIVDNVVRGGAIADPSTTDPDVQGLRRMHELIAAEPLVDATAMQTVGAKGYDGFTLAVVRG